MNESERIEKELTRNQLFSEDKHNFYTNRKLWDESSKKENGKILNSSEHSPRQHEMTSNEFKDIIGVSYHIADAPRPRSL